MAARPQMQKPQVNVSHSFTTQTCAHCSTVSKCRRRDFSEQAWAMLLAWEEVQKVAVDQTICDDCYNELREVLIDRADEVDAAIRSPHATEVVADGSMKAGASAKKVAPAKRSPKIAS